jgi:hypothetical protein
LLETHRPAKESVNAALHVRTHLLQSTEINLSLGVASRKVAKQVSEEIRLTRPAGRASR